MLVGIHKDPYGKFRKSLRIYEAILNYNGIEHIRLEASESNFWDLVSNLDLFIFRWWHIDDHHQIAKTILPIIEKEMGIKCFPNMATCWHYDDKIRQYYLLRQKGFPYIESWIFWDKKMALKWLEDAEFPIVFKLKSGAGSNNVILVKNRHTARYLVNKCFSKGIRSRRIPNLYNLKFKHFNLNKTIHRWGGNILRKLRDEDISSEWQRNKNYVLFQKFLPNNNFDTRITVIGERAFAFRRFTRDNDFRASGSGKIDYDVSSIDIRCVEISLDISRRMGFQSMAYDFVFNQNKDPEIAEISYNYADNIIFNCCGYFDLDLNWHGGHFWPHYFQLVDVLNLPDLKQPEQVK